MYRLISCMDIGNKLDPSRLEIADIGRTTVCPVTKMIKTELRKRGIRKLKVLYSRERPTRGETFPDGSRTVVKKSDGGKYFFCDGNCGISACRRSCKGYTGGRKWLYAADNKNIDDTGNKTERLRNRNSEFKRSEKCSAIFLEKTVFLQKKLMSQHTTFKIGGPADYFLVPEKSEDVGAMSSDSAKKKEIPYFILGNGSNLLVGDGGYRGASDSDLQKHVCR